MVQKKTAIEKHVSVTCLLCKRLNIETREMMGKLEFDKVTASMTKNK